jgi:hypothetical protein
MSRLAAVLIAALVPTSALAQPSKPEPTAPTQPPAATVTPGRDEPVTEPATDAPAATDAPDAGAEPAQPAAEVPPTAATPSAHPAAAPVTAAAIATAPPPEAASGVAVARPEPGRGVVKPVLLAVPRLAVTTLAAPVRLGLWAEDEYHLSLRFHELFWNDADTIGLYPVATWDGGSGVTGGAQLAMTDLGGATLHARATAGNRERQWYSATLGSGRLLGPARLWATGRYRDVARTSFYGYGDADETSNEPYERDDDGTPLPPPIDPRDGEQGIDAQYGFDEWMVSSGLTWNATRRVSMSLGGSMRWVDFSRARGTGDGAQVEDVYMVDALGGYQTGLEALRGELGVMVDQRRTRYRYLSMGAPSSGWAAQAFGGYQKGLGDDPTEFPYVGLDAVGYIDLYRGDRVIAVRLSVDGVLADIDEVPFIDLPTLGGRSLLRGYSWGRFRDRFAYVASAEYSYPIARWLGGFLFVDTGRVARDADELADDAPRVGFGIGLQLLALESMLARGFIAATADGDYTTVLTFEASFAPRRREAR